MKSEWPYIIMWFVHRAATTQHSHTLFRHVASTNTQTRLRYPLRKQSTLYFLYSQAAYSLYPTHTATLRNPHWAHASGDDMRPRWIAEVVPSLHSSSLVSNRCSVLDLKWHCVRRSSVFWHRSRPTRYTHTTWTDCLPPLERRQGCKPNPHHSSSFVISIGRCLLKRNRGRRLNKGRVGLLLIVMQMFFW